MNTKTLQELIGDLGFRLLTHETALDVVLQSAYASDLLSDVMGKAQEDMLWITSQVHKNIVAVASLKELAAIVVVSEREVENEVIAHADEEGVAIVASGKPMFETAGAIYDYFK